MEFISDFALFALKTAFIAGAILLVATLLFQLGMSARGRGFDRGQLEVEKLNDRFVELRHHLQSHLLGKKQFKALLKQEAKEKKSEEKARHQRPESASTEAPTRARKKIFVLDFDGDVRATQTQNLREEITAILSVAEPTDEVVVRLESGGGLVTSYGLAASQLMRIKTAKIKLVICIDKIAASGGYMMACVADRILAAPFAVVGSIGVIAHLPNLYRVLKKHDVDYREITAGQFKRTVSLFGEVSEPGLQKFREQIEETHSLFKTFVHENRPTLDLEKVATGEHWYARQAAPLGLIDEITTSDEYLASQCASADIYRLRMESRKSWWDRVSETTAMASDRIWTKLWTELDRKRFES